MPVINIGDIQIPVQMAQKTTPSLKIMDATGTIYYVDAMAAACPNAVKISDGENIYSIGNQTLVYQAENFNSCDTVSLEPGCYYAEIRGGRGGDGGNNADSGGDAQIQTYSFVISQQTDVVVFRGGDGNAGGVNQDDGIFSGGGGGASGVPSMIAVDDDIIVSYGGAGGRGGGGIGHNDNQTDCGRGGGGNAGENSNGSDAIANYTWTNSFLMCGAGGGGAPSGNAGVGASAVANSYGGNPGGVATSDSGGAGGDAWRIVGSTSGGGGGATISFSCAGQTLYSYGGGGGGAIQARMSPGLNLDGGAGASGTTGTSESSFVRIYRFG